MAVEVEHKFLLANDGWRGQVQRSEKFVQGYLGSAQGSSIRVRISGERAWLNIKSATPGNRRLEYEYAIPLADAEEIIRHLCIKPVIEKVRHFIGVGGHTWEIDEFGGDNQGLVVAEIELESEGEPFDKPDWLGEEVTNELRYYNNQLVLLPYNKLTD